MAGIVLVMKPPFIFPSESEPPYLRNTSDRALTMGQGRNISEIVRRATCR